MSFRKFNISMPENIYTQLKEKADDKGLGVSTYIRLCVIESIQKDKNESEAQ
jgi:hypothetical protein